MDKTKTIAVVAVAIIVVAAAAVVLMNRSDGGSDVAIESELLVFGNANGDYTVNQADLDIINEILKEEDQSKRDAKLSENPLADANNDGHVDQDDADLVKKIINDEPCTVYHYNASNVENYVVSTAWPVKSAIATASANQCWLMTMAGITDMVHGISYSMSSAPDPTLFPEFSKMESIGGSSTKLPVDKASTYISQYGVTAVITDKTESTVDKKTVEPQYEKMGVDVIRVGAASVDVTEYCQQLFLIGFLFQTEEQCEDIAKWWLSMQAEIDSKTANVEKKSAITCNGSISKDRIWVSAGTSDYVDVITHAGGEYALDDKVLTDYTSGAYFSKSDTWLYNYDFDYIINIKTNDWYSGAVDDTAKYEECLSIFDQTKAYQNKNAYVITGDAPIPIRVSYAAAVMYPDLFTEEWADEKNQEFMDKFTDVKIDVSSLHFIISYDTAYPKA